MFPPPQRPPPPPPPHINISNLCPPTHLPTISYFRVPLHTINKKYSKFWLATRHVGWILENPPSFPKNYPGYQGYPVLKVKVSAVTAPKKNKLKTKIYAHRSRSPKTTNCLVSSWTIKPKASRCSVGEQGAPPRINMQRTLQ